VVGRRLPLTITDRKGERGEQKEGLRKGGERMNEYPEELRNPVVPVVALVGQTSIHPIIEKNILTKMLYPFSYPLSPFPLSSLTYHTLTLTLTLLAHDEKRRGRVGARGHWWGRPPSIPS
jgi:hypothetical protein